MSDEGTTISTTPVTVGWYLHPFEAAIARGRLESEGIPAFVQFGHHSHQDWLITLALGGIRLQVPPSLARAAADVLASVEPLDDEEAGMECPACGRPGAEGGKASWRIAFIALHLFAIPLPFSLAKKRCRACGATWAGERGRPKYLGAE